MLQSSARLKGPSTKLLSHAAYPGSFPPYAAAYNALLLGTLVPSYLPTHWTDTVGQAIFYCLQVITEEMADLDQDLLEHPEWNPLPEDGGSLETAISTGVLGALHGWPAPFSEETILCFLEGLPKVSISELDDNSKICGISRGTYEEEASLDAEKPEEAVQLACSHIFRHLCWSIVLKSTSANDLRGCCICPLCRNKIPV